MAGLSYSGMAGHSRAGGQYARKMGLSRRLVYMVMGRRRKGAGLCPASAKELGVWL